MSSRRRGHEGNDEPTGRVKGAGSGQPRAAQDGDGQSQRSTRISLEPLAVAGLLTEAWEGATAALARAHVSPVPPAPAYPADLAAAYALHAVTFPALADNLWTACVRRLWCGRALQGIQSTAS
jgi:hypothetical protein